MTNRLPALGDLLRDRVTKLEGIATAHSQHLAGCDRLFIEPKIGADGKRIDGCWVDIDMLEIVEPCVVERVEYTALRPGGVDLPSPR